MKLLESQLVANVLHSSLSPYELYLRYIRLWGLVLVCVSFLCYYVFSEDLLCEMVGCSLPFQGRGCASCGTLFPSFLSFFPVKYFHAIYYYFFIFDLFILDSYLFFVKQARRGPQVMNNSFH